MRSQAVEDYLKAIYKLEEEQQKAGTSALADKLGVKPSSVTAMLKRLDGENPKLVDYRQHRGVSLTSEGRQIALEMTRRHRLLERFLVDVLGYGWEEVHDEAEQLEHAVSPRFLERLSDVLHHPIVDPHGHPIPGIDGVLPEISWVCLSDLEAGERATLRAVQREDSDLLRFLSSVGLTLGTRLEVLEAESPSGVRRIRLAEGNREVVALGDRVANDLRVEREQQER